MMRNEYNNYDELFETILSDPDKEEVRLANIFKISEENQREITQIDVETLKYFLPKKVREEFMGDMYELVAQMENEERKKYFIWFVIILQYVFVMLGQIKSIFQFNVNKEISNK